MSVSGSQFVAGSPSSPADDFRRIAEIQAEFLPLFLEHAAWKAMMADSRDCQC